MRIVVFSLGVVFPVSVQGGSQKILRELTLLLGERGHFITIFCPKRNDNYVEFNLSPNVIVKPILPLKGTFPMPYSVSPFELYETCKVLSEAMEGFDLFYCHDGGLCIELLKNVIPTVISLRDFCYPETLLGALNFNQSAIIVNSDHTYNCLLDTFARINPAINGKVHLIYNGYDPILFSKKASNKEVLEHMGLPEKKDLFIIGFPHRPQMDKGVANAIRVINNLKFRYPNIRLLIPLYMDINLSTRTDDTYDYINRQIVEYNLQEQIVFHPWIKPQHMAYYYSYCDVVLNIGDFVESFSNVAVESLLCETPVITFNIATYRSMPIRNYLRIVEYDDIDAVTDIISDMIIKKSRNYCDDIFMQEARSYIVKTLSQKRFLDQYERVFKEVLESTSISSRLSSKNTSTSTAYYRLTAWNSYTNGHFYNDYDKKIYEDKFMGLFCTGSAQVSEDVLLSSNISKETINWFENKGIIMKVKDEF